MSEAIVLSVCMIAIVAGFLELARQKLEIRTLRLRIERLERSGATMGSTVLQGSGDCGCPTIHGPRGARVIHVHGCAALLGASLPPDRGNPASDRV